MLRSSNPILSKRDAFTPAAPQYGQGYGQQPYQGYPAQGGFGGPQSPWNNAPTQQAGQGRMTLDDVITKTAVTIGILVVAAALAWTFVPDGLIGPAAIVSALVGFVVVLLVSFRRVVSPSLVIAYAAIEGVFIGMISKVFEYTYSGIVAQAVIATFFAAGVLMLVNVVAVLLGFNGLRGGVDGSVGPLAWLISGVAIVLAVLNLVLDFDYVERGVEMGAPANESWRAAFGLTVTMVWLYIELLRLISYIRR
jgi:uncharacterized YccA/Bax inhibitor family protein